MHRLEAAACAEARAERRRTEAELERLQVPCEYPISTPCEQPKVVLAEADQVALNVYMYALIHPQIYVVDVSRCVYIECVYMDWYI